MYERFTDRARKSLVLANQEARRFNHEYVGTEHMLLGLIKEGGGVACEYLLSKGIDLRKVRLEIEKIVQSGPDIVQLGKLPLTPRAKKVIEYANEVSREMLHNFVGTQHMLIGMLREKEGVAAQILESAGITEEEAASAIFATSNLEELLRISGIKPERLPGFEKPSAETNQDAEDKCKSKLQQVAHVLVRYFFGAEPASLTMQKLSEIVDGSR